MENDLSGALVHTHLPTYNLLQGFGMISPIVAANGIGVLAGSKVRLGELAAFSPTALTAVSVILGSISPSPLCSCLRPKSKSRRMSFNPAEKD